MSPTGRVYIGQSKNLLRRIKSYKKIKCKTQPKLYKSLLKYGFDWHNISVIEMFADYNTKILNKRERYWQQYYDSVKNGLNCILADDPDNPREICDETRKRISEGQLNSPNSRKGKKHSEKSRALIKIARANQIITQHHKDKISENSGSAKLILNTETGIYYRTIKEAAHSINITSNYLVCSLIGRNKNNRQFIYA